MKKIILITGATSGYGLATALKCKANGFTVIIASRSAEKVQAVRETYGFDDGYVLDVTDYNGWLTLKKQVLEKYGRIDILVNNAGTGVRIAELSEQTKDTIDEAVAINLNGVIYGSQIFGDVMKQQQDGIIINISSVCARHCWPGWSVYAAAKAGVLNFTKSLYVELQPYGVRATCIIPAAASTGFNTKAGLQENEQSLTADDIANAVFYAVTQPKGVCVEEMTVWGTSQIVQPL